MRKTLYILASLVALVSLILFLNEIGLNFLGDFFVSHFLLILALTALLLVLGFLLLMYKLGKNKSEKTQEITSVPTTPQPDNTDKKNDADKKSNWLVLNIMRWLPVAVSIFYIVLALVLFIVEQKKPFPGGIKLYIIVLAIGFCHLVFASIKIIGEQERAVPIFYGIIGDEWESGPHYALPPFYRIRIETKNSIQVDFGTIDENNIERASRSEESMSWYVMKEPVRINWGDIKSSGLSEDEQEVYKNDPLANTITTDPHIYFIIKISSLKNLIERVGGLEEAMERIKDTCTSALSEMAGKTFAAKARKEIDELSEKIQKKVEALVGDPDAVDRGECKKADSWGIDVEEVRIKDIGAPRDTNKALALRSAAIATADGEATATIRKAASERKRLEEEGEGKAKAVKTMAEAEKERLEKEGEGRANAIKKTAEAEKTRLTQEGEGRAAALKTVAEAASSPGGELVIKTDTLGKVMTASGGKIVVVPSDLSSLTGAIMGAVEAVKTAPSPLPTAPESKSPSN